MFSKINWLALVVAAVAGMFIGFLWYGAFFNAQWSEAVGLTGPGLTTPGEEVLRYGKPVTLDPVTPMIANTGLMLLYGLFMGWLTGLTGHTSFAKGATLGAVVGLVFAANDVVGNMFSMDSSTLSLIDGSYHLVLFTVIGAIMGGWRKK